MTRPRLWPWLLFGLIAFLALWIAQEVEEPTNVVVCNPD